MQGEPGVSGCGLRHGRRAGRVRLAQVEEAVEQQAILDSIQLETEVEANHRYVHEAQVEVNQLFANMESNEEPDLAEAANDHEAGLSGSLYLRL